MLQVPTRKFESHISSKPCWRGLSGTYYFSWSNFYSKIRRARVKSDMNRVLAMLKKKQNIFRLIQRWFALPPTSGRLLTHSSTHINNFAHTNTHSWTHYIGHTRDKQRQVQTHTYIPYTHTYTQIHRHTNTYTHKKNTHRHKYTHNHTHTQPHIHTNTHTHIHTYTYTHKHTNKHTHTNSHTHTQKTHTLRHTRTRAHT